MGAGGAHAIAALVASEDLALREAAGAALGGLAGADGADHAFLHEAGAVSALLACTQRCEGAGRAGGAAGLLSLATGDAAAEVLAAVAAERAGLHIVVELMHTDDGGLHLAGAGIVSAMLCQVPFATQCCG